MRDSCEGEKKFCVLSGTRGSRNHQRISKLSWSRRIITGRPSRDNKFKKKYVLTTPYYYDHNTRNSPSSPPRGTAEKKSFHLPRLQPSLETRCRGRRSRNPPFPEERERRRREEMQKKGEGERQETRSRRQKRKQPSSICAGKTLDLVSSSPTPS